MKYRIVRRWTTKTNTATGKIVEISEDQFYIQGRNFSPLFLVKDGEISISSGSTHLKRHRRNWTED